MALTKKQKKLPMALQKAILKKQKQTKKISGKQKLKDLGLDDDEINALLGV